MSMLSSVLKVLDTIRRHSASPPCPPVKDGDESAESRRNAERELDRLSLSLPPEAAHERGSCQGGSRPQRVDSARQP